MYVHINVTGSHCEVKEIRYLFALRNHSLESRHDCLVEIRVLHVTVVDEEELMGTFLTRRLRFSHKACYLTHRSVYIDRQQILIQPLAKDVDDTLANVGGTKIHQLGSIALQGKSDLRINQDDALEGCKNVVQLGRV